MEQIVLLLGGIGDFLQYIPFIDANRQNPIRYRVVSHLKGAPAFFQTIGIKPESISIFSTLDEQNKILQSFPPHHQIIQCPRFQYFDTYPFDHQKPLFTNCRPTVGVHIGGSSFSIDTQKKFGMILKSIPAKVIEGLRSKDYNLMVFGLEEELKGMEIKQSETLKFICDENPAKSLAYVNQCHAVVGSDSGIKTMSSMNRIPTFVWLGDYRDDPRDQLFIEPYIKDGVMDVFRYKDVGKQFEQGMTMTKEFLSEIL
jgi:hypothetical protein